MSATAVGGLLHFVGRATDLGAILRSIEQSACPAVNDIEGVEGVGKTTFLRKLEQELSGDPRYVVARVDVAGLRGWGQSPATDLDALRIQYERYRGLLGGLALGLPAESFGDFAETVDERYREMWRRLAGPAAENLTISGANVVIERGAKVNATVRAGDISVVLPKPDVTAGLREVLEGLARDFTARLNGLDAARRRVLLVDDFERALREEFGGWFLHDLVPELRDTVVVVARTESTEPLASPVALARSLGNFSEEDVRQYLSSRLGRKPTRRLVAAVLDLTGGHPQAVSVVADLSLDHADEQELLRLIEDMGDRPQSRLGDLVDRVVGAIDDEDVRRAFEVGWVLRWFDADSLRFMLAEDGAEEPRARDLIDRLREFSFTEVSEPGPDGRERCSFHSFIRAEMRRRLRDNQPAVRDRLHQRAADYYGGWLLGREESKFRDASPYRRWYRYEDPNWRTMAAEWLYHLGNFEDRVTARLELARLYFDAFWWWGCYVEFPFCSQLLTEWRRAQTDDEDRDWVALLQRFHDAYPTGYRKQHLGNWREVDRVLSTIHRLGGLNRVDDDLRRHVAALVAVFRAQARRYLNLDDARVDALYDEAYELFSRAEADSWCLPWINVELADVLFERGDPDGALERAGRTLELAEDDDFGDQDQEVIANALRVRADLAWQRGARDESFDLYAQAVFRAYAFQGFPEPPDFYTRAFYHEQLDRVRARLEELWLSGEEAAVADAASLLAAHFAPCAEAIGEPPNAAVVNELAVAGRIPELIGVLFPAEPSDEDVAVGSSYQETVIYAVDAMNAAYANG